MKPRRTRLSRPCPDSRLVPAGVTSNALPVLVLLAAGPANSAVVEFSQVFDPVQSVGFQPARQITEIPFFDTGLGTLDRVTISFSGTLEGSVFLRNFNPTPVMGGVWFQSGFWIVGTTLGTPDTGAAGLSPNVGSFFSLGPSPDSTTVSLGPTAVSGSFSRVPGDAGFSPFGVLDSSLRLSAGVPFPTPGVGTASEVAYIGGTLTVAYEYTPVPEPEEWAAFVGGALVLGAVWRRRRGC